MNQSLQTLILFGLRQGGDFYTAYTIIEERLPMSQVANVEQFFAWMEKNNQSLGESNIEAWWKRFMAYPAFERQQYKLEGGAGYKKAEEDARKDIADALATNSHEGLGLHLFGYPLKNVEVISYDKETKILTLKVK